MDEAARVREKIDIVALLSEYIPIKKMGRNYKALCPFHGEKTPSFVISPERQIWHCFGCSKGGDAFSFLMEYEHLEFPEALRILAKRAGIELAQSEFYKGVSSRKEKIYRVNFHAMQYYHYLLVNHNIGKKALEYLKQKRGMNDGAIKTFRLGFAPSFGNSASEYLLQKKGHTKEELIDAGIAYIKGRTIEDFFKQRVMFPLIDQRENVVGFSGRSLLDQVTSKYINTRETMVYHKGTHFFGIHSAKDIIKKEDKVIVVEGEFDVISAFQEGIKHVVAVKGSALTDEQINLLARFTKKISLCFDNDTAGDEALKRSLPNLEKHGMEITVVLLGAAKDPDELIKQDPIQFKKAIRESISVYDFLITKTLEKEDIQSPFGKKRITDELLPFFSAIDNEVVKEHYLKKLSTALDVSLESLLKQLEKLKQPPAVKDVVFSKVNIKRKRNELLEEYLVSLILQFSSPKQLLNQVNSIFLPMKLETAALQNIKERLEIYFKSQDDFDGQKFAAALPKELLFVFDTCYLFPIAKFSSDSHYVREAEKIALELKVLSIKSKIKLLGETLKKDDGKSSESLEELQKELMRLTNALQKTPS